MIYGTAICFTCLRRGPCAPRAERSSHSSGSWLTPGYDVFLNQAVEGGIKLGSLGRSLSVPSSRMPSVEGLCGLTEAADPSLSSSLSHTPNSHAVEYFGTAVCFVVEG